VLIIDRKMFKKRFGLILEHKLEKKKNLKETRGKKERSIN
jgi:hypothetical protein